MKKIIVLSLLFLGSIYAQVPVYVNVAFTSSSATSDSFYVPRGLQLSGLLVPISFTDTLTVQVSKNGGTGNWYDLSDNDGVALRLSPLTSVANAIPLKALYFYPWRCYRLVTTTSDKATKTVVAVCVPYLTNDK